MKEGEAGGSESSEMGEGTAVGVMHSEGGAEGGEPGSAGGLQMLKKQRSTFCPGAPRSGPVGPTPLSSREESVRVILNH